MENNTDDGSYIDGVPSVVRVPVPARAERFLTILWSHFVLDTDPLFHRLRSTGKYAIRRFLHHRMDEWPKKFKVRESL
jgi:hypothetical protein